MGKSALFIILLIAVSVKSQDLCPGQFSILPCTCYIFDGRPSVECNQIADEDQLEEIFSADFPESELQFFSLFDSPITTLSRNVFGNVSFNQVFIDVTYLHEISEDAFENSYETLVNFDVADAPVTQSTFPFASLGNYQRLVQVVLRNNLITQFPVIVSENLRFLLIVGNTYLTNVPADAFAAVGNLTGLNLQGCGITTLDDAAFRGAENLQYIRLRSNSLTTISYELFHTLPNVLELDLSVNDIAFIEDGALSNLPSIVQMDLAYNNLQAIILGEFDLSPNLEILDLIANQIVSVAPGTFDYLPGLQFIDLGFNVLTRLFADTFRGVNVTSIYVDNNAIDYIEADAFGLVQDSTINIEENLMTNVYSFWLQPLLDAGNFVDLIENPITCGCEISWLFDDPSYQESVLFFCANGTDFAALDPSYYIENC